MDGNVASGGNAAGVRTADKTPALTEWVHCHMVAHCRRDCGTDGVGGIAAGVRTADETAALTEWLMTLRAEEAHAKLEHAAIKAELRVANAALGDNSLSISKTPHN